MFSSFVCLCVAVCSFLCVSLCVHVVLWALLPQINDDDDDDDDDAANTSSGNVALKRPAFMSSVFSDPRFGGPYPASRAVDGNKDPVAMKVGSSCIHSGWDDNPWWAVDLGAALAVVGILFTNRAENFGNVSFYSVSIIFSDGNSK